MRVETPVARQVLWDNAVSSILDVFYAARTHGRVRAGTQTSGHAGTQTRMDARIRIDVCTRARRYADLGALEYARAMDAVSQGSWSGLKSGLRFRASGEC
eukprot:6199730-Pleurochrysis_carterae.AAC.1